MKFIAIIIIIIDATTTVSTVTRAINHRLFRKTNNNSITNVQINRFADASTSWCNTPHTATTSMLLCHLHCWFHIACLLHTYADSHTTAPPTACTCHLRGHEAISPPRRRRTCYKCALRLLEHCTWPLSSRARRSTIAMIKYCTYIVHVRTGRDVRLLCIFTNQICTILITS